MAETIVKALDGQLRNVYMSRDDFRLLNSHITQAIHRANVHLAVDWDDKGEALRQVANILKLAQLALADIEKANE